MKKIFILVFIFLQLLLPLALAPVVSATPSNISATIVVGQQDFTHGTVNQGTGSVTRNGFYYPEGVLVVGNKFLVADTGNSRILVYNSIPTGNNPTPDVVIGQQDFTHGVINQGGAVAANTLYYPEAMDTDGTKLFVADYGNNRLLIYNTVPTSNNTPADVVLTIDFINTFTGLHYDRPSGKLYLTHTSLVRIYVFNTIPTVSGRVVGTADYVFIPDDPIVGNITIINNKLVYAGWARNRVPIFNTIPTASGSATISNVIGQQTVASMSANQGGTVGQNTMKNPRDVVSDGTKLYVQDTGNHRILVFNNLPSTNNAPADDVIGQANFTSNSINRGGSVGANTLNNPDQGIILYNNYLITADGDNNRVLFFPLNTTDNPTTSPISSNSTNSSASKPQTCGNAKPEVAPQLFQIDTTNNKATLYFSPSKNNTSSYMIAYGYSLGDMRFGTTIGYGNSNTAISNTINALESNKTYYFEVRGGNGCMPGEWSNTLKATTLSQNNTTGVKTFTAWEQMKDVVLGWLKY